MDGFHSFYINDSGFVDNEDDSYYVEGMEIFETEDYYDFYFEIGAEVSIKSNNREYTYIIQDFLETDLNDTNGFYFLESAEG